MRTKIEQPTVFCVSMVENNKMSVHNKPHVIGIFNAYNDAKKFLDKTIKKWIKKNDDEGVEYSLDEMNAWFEYDTSDCIEWNIEEMKISK